MALSFRTQNRLANLIQSIAEGEKKTEVVRQVLAEQRLFEPHTAFRRIDTTRDGYISSAEIMDFLQENNIICSSREALQLFNSLDYNDDGLISYNDFVQTILPQEDQKLKTLATLRESYYLEPGERLPYEVEWGLSRIFEQQIKNFRNSDNLRDILHSSFDFNTLDSFNCIDEELLGFLDFESINLFMRSCNKVLSEEEIFAFIRVVGDQDIGKINYSDFQKVVAPNRPLESTYGKKDRSIKRSAYSSPKRRYIYEEPIYNKGKDYEYYDYISKTQKLSAKKAYYENSTYKSPSKYLGNYEIQQQQQSQLRSRSQNKYATPSKYSTSQQNFYQSPSQNIQQQQQQIIVKQSPMKGNEEEHLIKALKDLVNIDRDIEEIKKQLALRIDFNLLDAFRIFDKKGRGYVTKLETEIALNEIGIFPSKDEMYLFYKRFDKDSDGLLRYSEFCKAILPQSTEYSTIMNNRQPHYSEDDEGINLFEFETKYSFKKLLNKLLQGEIEAESLRQKLNRRPLFNIHDAFQAIDTDENGVITIDELKNILNDYGFFVSSTDLVSLVKRFDKNQDGKISYGEFLNEMTPKSPTKF